MEDDEYLARVVKSGLEESGYAVDWAAEGRTALEILQAFPFDVIILDIMLPDLDGFSLCQEIRHKKITTPVLMLTARYREDDKVRGLDSGADDYLVKPFSYPELYARLRALLRRTGGSGSSLIETGGLVLDSARKKLTVQDCPVDLTSKEYAVLEFLMLNRNGIVTREMLEEHIWDCEHAAFSNVIEVLISRIRRKLCPQNKEAYIKTVKGLGYIIKDE